MKFTFVGETTGAIIGWMEAAVAPGTAGVVSKATDTCEFGPSNSTATGSTGDDSSSVVLKAEMDMETSSRWA